MRRDSRPRLSSGSKTRGVVDGMLRANETQASGARLDSRGGCPYVSLEGTWR